MSYFNVGDKVIIKSLDDIINTLDEDGDGPSGIHFNLNEMDRWCGDESQIVDVNDNKDQDEYYGLRVDGFFVWDKAWLEPKVKPVVLPEELFEI